MAEQNKTDLEDSCQSLEERLPYHHEYDDDLSKRTYVCDVGDCTFEGGDMAKYIDHYKRSHDN